jgi:hypothetical protein
VVSEPAANVLKPYNPVVDDVNPPIENGTERLLNDGLPLLVSATNQYFVLAETVPEVITCLNPDVAVFIDGLVYIIEPGKLLPLSLYIPKLKVEPTAVVVTST